jgi:hypothetical protein
MKCFKLLDEVVIVIRYLEFQGQGIESSTSVFGKRTSTIHNILNSLIGSLDQLHTLGDGALSEQMN